MSGAEYYSGVLLVQMLVRTVPDCLFSGHLYGG